MTARKSGSNSCRPLLWQPVLGRSAACVRGSDPVRSAVRSVELNTLRHQGRAGAFLGVPAPTLRNRSQNVAPDLVLREMRVFMIAVIRPERVDLLPYRFHRHQCFHAYNCTLRFRRFNGRP